MSIKRMFLMGCLFTLHAGAVVLESGDAALAVDESGVRAALVHGGGSVLQTASPVNLQILAEDGQTRWFSADYASAQREGAPISRSAPMFSEHENNAFIMNGDWKLVGKGVSSPKGPEENLWELYNLADDRTELNNLVKQQPERARKMMNQWDTWSKEDKVYPKPAEKKKMNKKK